MNVIKDKSEGLLISFDIAAAYDTVDTVILFDMATKCASELRIDDDKFDASLGLT